MLKLLHNCTHLHTSKEMLNIIQARLQHYVNRELPDVQAGFRKGRGLRDPIANTHWVINKAREFQKKTSTSALLTMPMPLIVWITTNWKILKEMEIPDHLICSSEICMQVKKQQLELDMEQQTDSKLGNEYIKAIYCHPAYLAYMQTISCKMLGCMKLKKESRLLEEISVTSDMQMTHP